MSVLVSLEGQLGGPQRAEKGEPCNDIVQRTTQDESQLLTLLHVVFHTISTAMRFEPANAKFFHHEVRCETHDYALLTRISITLIRADLPVELVRHAASSRMFLDANENLRDGHDTDDELSEHAGVVIHWERIGSGILRRDAKDIRIRVLAAAPAVRRSAGLFRQTKYS